MKPTAILSTTDHEDYLFCLPLVAKSWELQGFNTEIAVYTKLFNPIVHEYIKGIKGCSIEIVQAKLKGISEVTESQLIRLYNAVKYYQSEYSVLSDIDMFICSNFLYRDFHKINVFGWDLTGQDQIPVCYVGMSNENWNKMFKRTNIAEDILEFGEFKKQHGMWILDQSILTGKLLQYGRENINFIDRGIDPNNQNLPIGRIDRYGGFKIPKGVPLHDAHLPRQPYVDENISKIIDMCKAVYPKENWDWVMDYRNEFIADNAKKRAAHTMTLK